MLVFTAMMLSAGMLVFMMCAVYFWIIVKLSDYIILHFFICISVYTAKQLDSGCRKCTLRTAANTTTDQYLNTRICQK